MLFQIPINYVISYVQYVANDSFLALLLEESTKKSKQTKLSVILFQLYEKIFNFLFSKLSWFYVSFVVNR